MENGNYNDSYKVILIGDSGVGKSSIVYRFTENIFVDSYITTIGVDFKIKTLVYNGEQIRLKLWDTAGQERFRTITNTYYRGSDGYIIVYDISQRESFKNLDYWLEQVDNYGSKNSSKIIIGNKLDTTYYKREVSIEEAYKYCNNKNIPYIEVSVKNDFQIKNIFIKLIDDIKEKKKEILQNKNDNCNINNLKKEKNCCSGFYSKKYLKLK
jgi:small GTP-binding protein